MKKNFLKTILLLTLIVLYCTIVNTVASAAENSITLTAEPIPTKNCISLNWTSSDPSQNYFYRLFSQGEDEDKPQSMPTKSSNIRVLNVYPDEGDELKTWIVDENFGKGLITVEKVTQKQFNDNPYYYLKNDEGQWKYDVVYFGGWNAHNGQGISPTGADAIREYANLGYGVLFGHDTIRGNGDGNFWALRDLVDIEYSSSIFGVCAVDRSKRTVIKVSKKGLLTNYPYQLNDELTIPISHTTLHATKGDIWFKFKEANPYESNANFYLTTNNNCAMIQTGNNNGAATDDEKKILTNTLLYLAQMSTNQSTELHKTQDFTAPDKPQIVSLTKNFITNETSISFESAKDNGNTYNFYVEGYPIENGVANKEKAIKSNLVSSTITTGIKGYIAVADDNKDTKLTDASMANSNTTFTCNKVYPSDYYIHVAAVDNAGNISETTTIKVPASFEIN